jgi:lysozyme family protein
MIDSIAAKQLAFRLSSYNGFGCVGRQVPDTFPPARKAD